MVAFTNPSVQYNGTVPLRHRASISHLVSFHVNPFESGPIQGLREVWHASVTSAQRQKVQICGYRILLQYRSLAEGSCDGPA
jgi:hypothetical protein